MLDAVIDRSGEIGAQGARPARGAGGAGLRPAADPEGQRAWARRAIRAGRVRLALQPVAEVARPGAPFAFHEALLRLLDEDGTPVAAQAFIEAVDGDPLVIEIDCAVVRLATSLLRADPALTLSINVSPVSLTDRRWHDRLACCLAPEPAIARRLIVELTERTPIRDLAATRAAMERQRAAGIRFALDDFGAGCRAMTHLRDLPFDMLKLDGAFTRGISRDPTQRAFVTAIHDLARHLGLPLVAEAVETEAEAAALAAIGVTHLQGYLVGRPRLVTR